MFTQESFEVFDIAGLDKRMEAIRNEIQPVFKTIDETIKKRVGKRIRRDSLYPYCATSQT
ncbi:hypothetical protein TMUPMC115_2184 [Tetragenococcus muriaticus PMC-11-5]|uniref:Uncharacterized protein n=1 Tax=Tetragenococcus muriaticus PMC-11-5 TaxID=1302649 RepID=A0A091BZ09_9ENTE|nr:hypothetical protein TMUPMC115_2184 [Tetragenococcus muriaticus PMC-11-5]